MKIELRLPTLLTPAEAELLSAIFSGEPVVLVRSGSGSGKSSAVRFLQGYVLELGQSMLRKGRRLPAGALMLLADFQDAADWLKDDLPPDRHSAQVEAFLTVLCERLDALLSQIDEAERDQAFEATFLREEQAQVTVATGITAIKLAVSRVASQFKGTRLPSDLALSAFTKTEFGSAHDKAAARLLLLQSVASRQREACGLGIVLAIDNIDPFPEYIQTALVKTIQTIVWGMHASPNVESHALTIAVFARLSTARRQSGALDGIEAHWTSFRSPDPAEIVFFRLAQFLRQPDSASGWLNLNLADQQELYGRALVLCDRLLDSSATFHAVFSAAAGTNIRTACKFARKWLLSGRLDAAGFRNREIDRGTGIREFLGLAIVLRISLALERCLEPDVAQAPLSEVPQFAAKRFFGFLLGILWSHGLVELEGRAPYGAAGPRFQIVKLVHAEIRSMLDPKNVRSLAAATMPLRRAGDRLARAGAASIADRIPLAQRVMETLNAVEEERAGRLEALSAADRELARSLCRALIEQLVEGIRANEAQKSVHEVAAISEAVLMPRDLVSPSRWEAIDMLVSSSLVSTVELSEIGVLEERESREELDDLERDLSAVNVFTPDRVVLAPIALHVLCILETSRDSVNAVALREQLKAWGFAELQIIDVLNQMVDIDRRLIYSGVKDANMGVTHWFDSFHNVHISSAGSGYLNTLVCTPAYLQWALFGVGEFRARIPEYRQFASLVTSGVGRLTLAVRAFERVAEDELERLSKLVQARFVPFDRSLSPFSWVYFRALRSLIEDASGLKLGRREEAAAAGRAFLEVGRRLLESRREVLGMNDSEWEESFMLASREFDARFSR